MTLKPKNNKISALALILLSILSSVGVSGLLSTSKTLTSSGSVKAINVEVYSEQACSNTVNSINWGTPEPGDIVTQTVYIKNTGSADMTLNLVVNNWSPAVASSFMDVTWNRQGYVLSPDDVVQTVITLTVSESVTGIDDFNSLIIIEGTG